MNIDPEILQQAGAKGAQSASRALSVMIDHDIKDVHVESAHVESVSLEKATDLLTHKDIVVAYTQILSGIPGLVLLVMGRASALNLVDNLLHKQVGTTKILQEMDKSAIKETLNILSNSYITALAEAFGVTLQIDVPYLAAVDQIPKLIDFVAQKKGETTETIIFTTNLSIRNLQSEVSLYVVFGSELNSVFNNNTL